MDVLNMRIRELRTLHQMTQRELSDKLGLTPKMISFYELGERNPPNDILNKMADIFSVTTDYLLGRTNTPQIKKDGSEEPLKLSDIEFALFGEVRELDDEDKAELLRDAQRMRELKTLREKSDGK